MNKNPYEPVISQLAVENAQLKVQLTASQFENEELREKLVENQEKLDEYIKEPGES